jgi:hypothetical protein
MRMAGIDVHKKVLMVVVGVGLLPCRASCSDSGCGYSNKEWKKP